MLNLVEHLVISDFSCIFAVLKDDKELVKK